MYGWTTVWTPRRNGKAPTSFTASSCTGEQDTGTKGPGMQQTRKDTPAVTMYVQLGIAVHKAFTAQPPTFKSNWLTPAVSGMM